MRHFWADRRLIFIPAVFLTGLAVQPANPQTKGGPPPASGGNVPSSPSPGSPGITTPRGMGNVPNGSIWNNGNDNGFPNRPMFISGRVLFDDGTRPNNEIRIERVCAANVRFEAHTDSKGRFSFQLDNNALATADMSAADTGGGFGPTSRQMDDQSNRAGRGGFGRYWNCELRASYPGYRSDVVDLANRRALDDPNVGTIVLHRLANVKGSTISLTTAMAPKHAQKEYQKGMQLAEKGKMDEAEKHLLAATTAYPKFAEAWFALGKVQQKENKPDAARKSFQASAAADSKYVNPYGELAMLAAREGKWDEAARLSKQVIDLDAVEYPVAFWYNALANYRLKKLDDAQKSAQELVKLDTKHEFPQAESMLAQIYLDKADYPEAAAHLKTYLTLAPDAKNTDALKAALLKIEQAETKK